MPEINMYEVIRRPLVTEKTNFQSGVLAQYSFVVDKRASKTQIKEAIEKLFDVTVVRVNTARMPAKRARNLRTRRMRTRRAEYKKAIVQLSDGDTIDVFEGVR